MISKQTVKTVGIMMNGFVKSNILPQSEASAVERILRKASVVETKQKMEKEKLLNAEEVSQILGVCRKTVLRMRKAGLLKGLLVTGSKKSLKFPEKEIEEFIFNKGADDE